MAKAIRLVHQPFLPGICTAETEAAIMAEGDIKERGAVSTRREVVDFILDLTGYTTDKALYKHRLLEPSFGDGEFLLAAAERLLATWRDSEAADTVLLDAIRAVELHHPTFKRTREYLDNILSREKLTTQTRTILLDKWLIQGDFLMESISTRFDYVVGNPPYVRHEMVPDVLMKEYRRRFSTIFDRADIYIPFIEKSLSLLSGNGKLGFICADRWMKNRYGGPLRKLVAEHYHLKFYVDMVDTPAFHSDVIAYPAITVISKEPSGPTRLARQPEVSVDSLAALSEKMLSREPPDTEDVEQVSGVATGTEPWILESFDRLELVRRIEREFPSLEDAGCSVGIGVATGADKFFVAPFEALDVEEDRKLPLVTTRDIVSGRIHWHGYGVVNPFDDEGSLVSLDDYPKLCAYLTGYEHEIRKRHVSRKNPRSWYRTIDRIHPALAKRPKLLIPDIKGGAHIVYEDGMFYPHHNLYYITSEQWDLKVLQAVLQSGIAELFVNTYSTKMRGGYLRFQAQYLRRICVPFWRDVPERLRRELVDAVKNGDISRRNEAVFKLYGMNASERLAFCGNGN